MAGGFDNESIAVAAICATFYLWTLALRRPAAESGAAQERGADGYSGPTAPRARGQRTLGDFVLRPSSSDSGADSPVVDLTGERREGAAGRGAA